MLLALATILLAGSGANAAEFSAAQRAEIVSILREALKTDPSILRDAVAALQSDDGERERAAARAALAATRDILVTPDDPVAGNPAGKVTIVEFFDVRCPYCLKLEPEMAAFLARDGDVRLVYKDLPILGAASVLGSKALIAAQKQNAYEKMRDIVMRNPSDISRASIEAAARKLGLDAQRLLADMDNPTVQARIDANLRLAHQLNIQGTPAMVVGDDVLPGAVSAAELARVVAQTRAARR